MSWIFPALLAMIVCGFASEPCQNAEAETKTVTFQSSTYNDMRQILARENPAKAVTIDGRLSFPDNAKEPYPTVVVVHGLGGYRDANEGCVAAALRKAGFATLTYERR
jgi:cephalosporin-C deacetylase-like acetyl esterase